MQKILRWGSVLSFLISLAHADGPIVFHCRPNGDITSESMPRKILDTSRRRCRESVCVMPAICNVTRDGHILNGNRAQMVACATSLPGNQCPSLDDCANSGTVLLGSEYRHRRVLLPRQFETVPGTIVRSRGNRRRTRRAVRREERSDSHFEIHYFRSEALDPSENIYGTSRTDAEILPALVPSQIQVRRCGEIETYCEGPVIVELIQGTNRVRQHDTPQIVACHASSNGRCPRAADCANRTDTDLIFDLSFQGSQSAGTSDAPAGSAAGAAR